MRSGVLLTVVALASVRAMLIYVVVYQSMLFILEICSCGTQPRAARSSFRSSGFQSLF
jgi:hypothetical protein